MSYFTTGEFAKLCKVNKQTLFYYDQIGLLSPAIKKENGYRYYSIRQFEVFSVIELFKNMGMSLKDIQSFIQNKSPESFLQLMYEQKEEIAKKKAEIEMIESIIHTKIHVTEEALQLDFDALEFVHLSEDILYLSRNIEDATEEEFVIATSEFIHELYHSQLETGYPIGGMTTREQILKGNYDNYRYLYMEQPNPKAGHPYFKAIAGNFLIGYHKGTEQTLYKTYDRMLKELEQRNLTLGEYVYEEYVFDAVVKNREEDYITKIMIEAIEK